jgi:transposase-like protein
VKFSAAKRKKAIALVAKGYSYKAAGEEIGADKNTVRRWCDEAGVRSGAADARTDVPRAPAPRAPTEPAAPTAPAETLDDILRDMSEQLSWTRDQAREAAKDGNSAAASKLNRDAASLANTVARIQADRDKNAGAGAFTFTKERLQQVRALLQDRVNRMAASPEGSLGVCPKCGAEIRMARASEPYAANADTEGKQI